MDHWIERAQSAEAKLAAMKEAHEQAVSRVQDFKANFGVREKQSGEIDIDFEKFANNLGIESALELRKIIDEVYQIRGAAGEKPRLRLASK